jgi:hypothetical protein
MGCDDGGSSSAGSRSADQIDVRSIDEGMTLDGDTVTASANANGRVTNIRRARGHAVVTKSAPLDDTRRHNRPGWGAKVLMCVQELGRREEGDDLMT